MTWLTPETLRWLALGIVALVAAGLGLYLHRRRRVARLLGDPVVIRQLLGLDLGAVPWVRIVVIGLATAALALALLDPAVASPPAAPRGPVVLLLDASGSMLVEDVEAPRLELQRSVARSLVAALSDTPVGIVAFAGRAFSLTPPTRDRGAVEMYLAALDPTLVPQTGSAFAAAVRQGITLLASAEAARGGSLVLFGDGDETEDAEAALAASALARRAGITVHTVGVGTAEGGPVPALDPSTGTVDGYLREPDGGLLVSRLDEDLLRAISSRGGGIHVSATDEHALGLLRDRLAGAGAPPEPDPTGVPRYALLAAAAFLLLLVEPAAARLGRRE
jgi:Ca-activated chloride channel homolog